VEAVDDPRERRRKIVYLTLKGHKTVNAIMKKIDPGFELKGILARDAVNRLYSA
jgi:DNA-binding MarR family transcriptional regulator